MKYLKMLFAFASLTITGNSCNKDKLNQPPLGALSEDVLATPQGVEGLLIGAYSMLDGINNNNNWGSAASNWLYGGICGTEGYKGSDPYDQDDMQALQRYAATERNEMLSQKWSAAYDGVARSNTVLRTLARANEINEDDRTRITAESRFLRGFYHFEAKKVFGNVPYVNEAVTYEAGNYYLSNAQPIWIEIEADFKFAMENLKPVMQAVGRANKYAAEAYLAKCYMFQQKYDSALALLHDLINNGVTALGIPYGLEKKFYQNFDPITKNSGESVFAFQSSVDDDSFGANGNMGDVLNNSFNTSGPGQCCGFYQPSQFLVNHFKTGPEGLPDLDNFNADDVKNDEGKASSDPFTPDPRPLDPRLDWTVGRRGIPYLDWGNHPGKDWIRNQDYGGPYTPMKNALRKSELAHFSDASFWTAGGATANNVNLIRFADVLLWAAEAEIEEGFPDNARKYTNIVRARAADPSSWVVREDGSYAANYRIGIYATPWNDPDFARKAVRYERMLELGMEGHRFFDLVRWGIADKEINAYIEKEKAKRTYLDGAKFIKGKNEYFPIPQAQIDLSVGPDGVASLKQNPGY